MRKENTQNFFEAVKHVESVAAKFTVVFLFLRLQTYNLQRQDFAAATRSSASQRAKSDYKMVSEFMYLCSFSKANGDLHKIYTPSRQLCFSSDTCALCIPSSSHLIYPLIARVIGAPQMISQPVSSIFPCSPLPSGTWRTPGLSIPSCYLPTSSSVCLVFFPLSLCLA